MTTKITISLPDHQVEAARRAVDDGRAGSVSGYISMALNDYEKKDSLAALLDDLDEEFGPLTEEHMDWARKALGR